MGSYHLFDDEMMPWLMVGGRASSQPYIPHRIESPFIYNAARAEGDTEAATRLDPDSALAIRADATDTPRKRIDRSEYIPGRH